MTSRGGRGAFPINRSSTSSSSQSSQSSQSASRAPQQFRWKVTEAPDPTPLGRTSATRPKRGRPRKHPLTEKEEEKRRKKDEQGLPIIAWQAPTPVYAQPPPGAQLIPWATEWPEILQFYMTNSQPLDPSGKNLYSPSRYMSTTGAFMNSFQTSPATLTLRILFVESSRPDRRSSLEKLLWLKGKALRLVNDGLRDPNTQLSASALSDIVTLHNYEQIFGEVQVARMHRKGLRRLVELMGGIENIRGDAALLVPMILWSDRSRQARRLHDPTEDPPDYPTDFEPGLQPLHPLNIALLPPDQLGTSAERGHSLGVSILGPGVRLMVALDALRKLSAGAAACKVYDNPAMAAPIREKLQQAEQGLLVMKRDQNNENEAVFFTSPKYVLQQLMFEAARLCGLVIAHQISAELLDRSDASRTKLDHALMRLGMLNARPLLEYYPRILLWILFIQGPLHEGPTRTGCVRLASQACSKIGLESWDATRAVLQSMYFYSEVQEVPCEQFWRETTFDEEPAVIQELTPPPDGPKPNESWTRYIRGST